MRSDGVRAAAVLVSAVLATLIGALGGSGAFGLSVGVVAAEYTTPVMPVPAAFSIWSLIYVAMLAQAVHQALPSQRTRPVHRATGWWLVLAALANTSWILVFTLGWVMVAQVVIVVLLVALATALGRLSARRAERAADRWLLYGPVALYTGWVSLATVVGVATTGEFLGVDSSGALGTVLATLVLLVVAGIAGAVTARAAAAVPYAAAVVWALGGIVVMGPPVPVVLAALAAVAVVVVVAVRRVVTAPATSDRTVAAFG